MTTTANSISKLISVENGKTQKAARISLITILLQVKS